MTELLTDSQIAEREAAYKGYGYWKAGMPCRGAEPNHWRSVSAEQEPAFLARLREAERLLAMCAEPERYEHSRPFAMINAYFARVRQTGA